MGGVVSLLFCRPPIVTLLPSQLVTFLPSQLVTFLPPVAWPRCPDAERPIPLPVFELDAEMDDFQSMSNQAEVC